MRKNFLLLLLLTLLPLAGWAQFSVSWKSGLTVEIVHPGAQPAFEDLLSVSSANTDQNCVYQNPYTWEQAGQNGTGWGDYSYCNHYNYSVHETSAAASSPTGTVYTGNLVKGTKYYLRVWGRYQTDLMGNNDRDYRVMEFQAGTKCSVTGLSLGTGLEYKDNNPVTLITGTATLPSDYDWSHGGVEFIVKTAEGLPAATEHGVDVAEATDAGLYFVYCRAKDDGDLYEDGDWQQVGTTGVKINKAEFKADAYGFTAPVALTDAVFTGLNQKLFTDGVAPAGGAITYSLTSGGTFVAGNNDAVKVLHVADATKLYYKVSESDNYLASDELSIDLTMAKATYTVSEPTIGTFEYDGNLQGPLATPSDIVLVSLAGAPGSPWYASSGRIEYSITKNAGSWVIDPNNDILKRKNAGTYTITYRTKASTAENADFEPVEGTLEFTIDKADWTVTEGTLTADWQYDGTEHSLATETTAEGKVTSDPAGVVKYYIGDKEVTYAELVAKNVNADPGYEVSYSVEGTKNFNKVDKKSLGFVKVTKKDLHVVAKSQEVFYGFDKETGFDADAFMATLKEGDDTEVATGDNLADILAAMVGFESIESGTVDGTTNTITEWPEDAAVYNFWLKDLETAESNYHLKDFMPNGKLTIKQADNAWDATVTITPDTWDYGTAPSEPTATPHFGDVKDVKYKYFNSKGEEITLSETTDAGTYTVKAYLTGNANYKDLETADIDAATFTISPINKTWATEPSVASDGWIYREGPSAYKTAVASDGAEVTYEFFDAGMTKIDPATDADLKELEVGTYYMVATAAATNNYNVLVSDPIEFTVSPAVLPALAFTYDAVTYNAENQKPTDASIVAAITKEYPNILPANYVITFTDEEGNITDEFKNTGKYYVVITGYANYAGEVDGVVNFQKKEFVINDFVATVTAPEAKKDLIYNNSVQELVKAGAAKGVADEVAGTFTYRLSDDAEWSKDLPTATNAGTYNVQWKFTAADNYAEDANGKFDVTIQKVNLMYMLGNTEKTWNGATFTPEELKAAYTLTSAGTLQGDDISNVPFTISMPADKQYTDAGEYTLSALAYDFGENPENYAINFTGTAKLTINKDDLVEGTDFTAPTAAKDLVYTGNAQDLVEAGKLTDTKYATGFKYATTEKGEYTETIPQGTEKGDYSVWYIVEGDANHNATEPVEITNSIAAAELTPDMLADVYYDKTKKEYKEVSEKYDATVKTYPNTLDLDEAEYDVELTYAGAYVLEEGEELAIKHAGTYTYTFTGKKNYTGTLEAEIEITPADLIATAPNAVKTYDATTVIEDDEFGKPMFTGLLSGDQFNYGEGKKIGDFVVVPDDAIDVNEDGYELTLSTLPAQVDYTIIDYKPGTLTINPAAAVTIGFKSTAKYSKEYGTEADGLVVVPGDLEAKAGEFFDDFATIKDQLTISRAEGEIVGNYPITLAAKANAEFVNNYKEVKFAEGGIFSITPFEGEIKVSIASAAKTYDSKAPELAWAEDLSNMIVVGAPVDIKEEIFVEGMLPTITIVDASANAGIYNIKLEGGTSTNYKKISFIEGSYYSIDPFMVKGVWNNKPVANVGDAAADIMAKVDWTVAPADEDGDAEFLAANEGLFDVKFADGVVADGKIATADGKNALVLFYTKTDGNFEIAENEKSDLNIGGTDDNAIALDDSKPVETSATLGTSTVTFTQSRAVAKNVWQACVLPFTVTPAEISDAFGYAAVDVFDETRTNADEVHFCLKVTGEIEAGTPFLFKTDNDRNFQNGGVKFEGVEVVPTSTLNPVVEDDDTDIQFIGTFELTPIYGEQFRYLSSGTWYNAGAFTEAKPANIKPLRAYLNMGSNASARIFIEEPDGTTSIMDVNSFNNMMSAEGWYTIDGKKLNAAPTQKGVYIQNGKKVVIK